MSNIMTRPSPLDDPDNAQFAWAHFRRLMRWFGLGTLALVCVVLGGLYWMFGAISPHFYIATGLGIAATMMLACALMGLVFLSAGTGHDASIVDPTSHRGDD